MPQPAAGATAALSEPRLGWVPSVSMRSFRRGLLVGLATLLVAGCTGDDPEDARPDRPLVASLDEPLVGERADDLIDRPFELFDGGSTTLRQQLEGPVVVNFWATWCTPCIHEMPDFEEVHQELGDRVRFIGINEDSARDRAAAQRMVAETGVTYLIGWDPDESLIRAAGATAMPTTLLIDDTGEIVDTHLGPLNGDQLREKIEEELGVG